MKINDYPIQSELNSSDKFIIEGGGGTKTVSANTIAEFAKSSDVEEVFDIVAKHRNTFRGKNLGSSLTDDQLEEIQNGTFNDLYVGDYWTINGHNWRIIDIDSMLNSANMDNSYLTTNHHLVIMPDYPIYSTQAYTGEQWKSGYVGTTLYNSTKTTGLNLIENAFGEDNIIGFKTLLINGIDDSGKFTSYTYDTVKCCVPSYYDLGVITPSYDNYRKYYLNQLYIGQFSLFRLNPKYIAIDDFEYWLSDMLPSLNQWRIVGKTCGVMSTGSFADIGVRPYFLIG